jgi:hypothetical protein
MKKILVALMVVLIMGICVDKAEAATATQGFHDCKIVYVGSFFGSATLGLTSSDWTGTVWVDLDVANEKSMLATALTAKSTGSTVSCWIKEYTTGNQLLLGIGILEN